MNVSAQDASARESVPERREPHRVGGRRLLLAVVLAAGLAVAVGYATVWILGAAAPSWVTPARLGSVVSAEVYLMVVAALVVAFGGIRGLRERLRLTRATPRDLRLALTVWIVTWLVAVAINVALDPLTGSMGAFLRDLEYIGSDGGRLAEPGALMLMLSLVRVLFLVPLAEELLFRGALFGWLRQRLNVAATITITAVVFAAMHAMPGLLILTLVIGLGAAWVRERTGSTTPYVVAHALNGLTMFTVAYLTTGWTVP